MPDSLSYCIFETALGPCGLLWNENAFVRLQLPEKTAAATRRRLLEFEKGKERDVDQSPSWVLSAIEKIQRHLNSGREDLSQIPLDLSTQTDFFRRVYETAKQIPPGRTLTYGDLAERVGVPGGARAIGQAMGKNPFALIVPCHRIVAAGGKMGGFSAWGGATTKKQLLDLEAAATWDWIGDFEGGAQQAARLLQKNDEVLRAVIRRIGPCTLSPKRGNSTFEALSQSIIFQQLSGKAAQTILGRFIQLFPGPNYPSPEAVAEASEERLRSAGLSRAKALAIKDLAAKTIAGEVPSMKEMESMSEEAIIRSLTKVRGIGRWTVEMLLIFDLGRVDVLPVADYAIRKAYAQIHGKRKLPEPTELAKWGERWKPYRSIASWYLWRSLDA